MPTDIEHLADRLIELFETVGPGDTATVDALRELYHPDVRFTDPVQQVQGRDAFLEANRRLARRCRELSFQIHDRATTHDQIFLTWTMRIAMRLGPRVEETGVTHIRCLDGLVIEHRDYWDIAALIGSAVPGGRRLLRAAFKPFV